MADEWTVAELLKTSSAYWRGSTLQAGVRLGVFSVIGGGKSTVGEIAAMLETDERATGYLLDALASMGLLTKKNDSYLNSRAAAVFLDKESPDYVGYIILHHHHLMDGWAQLDEAVTHGTPVVRRSYGEEAEREAFLMGMFNLAMATGPKVAEAINLAECRHLLDLGGGPGTYAIHFCLANPEMHAVIYDRATTKPFAEKTVEKFGMAQRIRFVAGNFTQDPISGGPFDVAWLSHILHSNGPDECQQFIDKVVSVMEPGGRLLIHDFILNNDKAGPEFPALFSLNMLLNNPVGRAYSEEEIDAMLQRAGLSDIHRLSWLGPNGSAIIEARVG